MNPCLQIQHLTKTYRNNREPAVADVSLSLDEGRLLSLVGESGSGKTTLLRLVAGLEAPDAGTVSIRGRELSAPGAVTPPETRGVGLVFQHHNLFPHLKVAANITYGIRSTSRKRRRAIVAEMLELIGLPDFGDRYPHQLSGGERQRVALARALAPEPRLLLLDEPFSSLDARLRLGLREDLRAILAARGATALFVTHDTRDALAIADRVAVLRHGELQQEGTPAQVYHAPANAYIASFFGTCNFLPLDSLPSGGRGQCHIGPGGAADASLWIRPEDLELRPVAADGDPLVGRVEGVAFHGTHLEVRLGCRPASGESFHVTVRHTAPEPVEAGQTWAIVPKPRRSMARAERSEP